MSSPEPDSQLAQWLPRLEAYRKAIATAPSAETKLAISEIPVESIDTHPLPIETETTCIVHLPIDGILKQIKKAKSFVLGIGSVGESDPTLVRTVVTDLVARCCRKIDRNGILITVRTTQHILLNDSFRNVLVREASWSYFGDTKVDMKAWHSQLAVLPGWKQEYPLIVFDLGDIRFPMMPRIGRLCDGIVVQMLNPSDSRETIQALKSLQKDRLKILGAWSVELSKRNQAA